ncbi:MAG: HAMP domain-containing protein, partial [Chloroflexi bacterium]|nr:HAMP domain-containing protein [Chloroflexota bacterium]
MNRILQLCTTLPQRWHLSLFEKVILVNSFMLIGEAVAGLWVTSHNLEAHHYLIDTGFIVLATLLTLLINILLLRASFRPLFSLLATIREVSAGQTNARAATSSDSEIGELARAFNSMLDRLEAARLEQTRLILQAQEEERRRIALELHDETGQNLTALLIHTEVLNQSLQAFPSATVAEDARKHLSGGLQQLTRLTQQTLENIRVLAQQLRPSVLDDLGLLAAFRWLVEDSQQRLHLELGLHVDSIHNAAHDLPPAYETTLFRIAQESLTNIVRHAHTRSATIWLGQDEQHISLRIHDDGCGYDATQHHAGSGILGM